MYVSASYVVMARDFNSLSARNTAFRVINSPFTHLISGTKAQPFDYGLKASTAPQAAASAG
ncbi:hypothetical protein DAQ1742_03880 [Dickeya aquatica]|uniref:Uncharacterized protein n=1 Tax=Dickeya aquatica TaxID=1401087 RepID=A0A375AEZ2_9GAMM|nr:hypothetical protein DAQ1742_03880 [Dickeya aquatica]